MKDVFISYAHQDKPVADALCRSLEEHGVSCWIAPRDILPGISWSEAIIEGIEESRTILLVFSGASNNSVQVSREIERAVHKGVTVVPVRIENILPNKKLEYFLSSVHWLDAWDASVESHIPRVSEAFAKILNHLDGRSEIKLEAVVSEEKKLVEKVDPELSSAGLDHVQLREGEVLFRQGDLGDSLYVLEYGRMSVSVHAPDGEERMLLIVQPMAILGEMSWLLDSARTTTLTAVTEAKLWCIPHKKLQEDLKNREAWAIKLTVGIAQSLASRVDSMNKELLTQMAEVQKLQDGVPSGEASELEGLCERLMGKLTL